MHLRDTGEIMKTRFELGSIGIIAGDNKRILENYTGNNIFRQRKSYDEYYVDVTNCEVEIELDDLMRLSRTFIIAVWVDALILTER